MVMIPVCTPEICGRLKNYSKIIHDFFEEQWHILMVDGQWNTFIFLKLHYFSRT